MIFKSKEQLLQENKQLKDTINILQTTLEDMQLYIRNKAVIEASLKFELKKALKLKGDN